jgi:hypothetical protein
MTLAIIQPGSPDYPAALLRSDAGWTPPVIQTIGNLALLRQPLTAPSNCTPMAG